MKHIILIIYLITVATISSTLKLASSNKITTTLTKISFHHGNLWSFTYQNCCSYWCDCQLLKVNEESYCQVSLLKWLISYQNWASLRSINLVLAACKWSLNPIFSLAYPLSLSSPLLKQNQNSSSTPSPSKWLCPFNNSNISPNKKKSPIKSNKAGSSSRKLWIISKYLRQYDCVLKSSQIFTFVTTYYSFIQYLSWPRYLTLYARNYITIKF